MDIDKKEKIKKVCFWTLNIISYVLSALFILFLLIGLNGGGVKTPSKKSIRFNDNISQPYQLIYDEDNSTFTLSAYETQQCLQHFYDEIDLHDSFENIALGYQEETFTYVETNQYTVSYSSPNDNFLFFLLDTIGYYGEGNEPKPYNYFFIDEDDNFLSYDLIIIDDGITNIDAVYQALQKDLVYADNHNFIINIFSSITNSLIDFVSTINSGLVSIVALFWVGGNLTTLGILTTIVVAVSLSYFLLRLIFGLIRLRG